MNNDPTCGMPAVQWNGIRLLAVNGWKTIIQGECVHLVPEGVGEDQAQDFYGGITLQVVEARPGESVNDVHLQVQGLMGRRVRQGTPESTSAQFGGRRLVGYSWTDGLGLIESYFLEMEDRLIEIQLTKSPFPVEGGVSSAVDVAKEFIVFECSIAARNLT